MGRLAKSIIGMGLGWAFGGPIGMILGVLIANVFYKENKVWKETWIGDGAGGGNHHGPYHNTGTRVDMDAALMVLIAAVMKADGNINHSELDYVKRWLLQNYGEQQGNEMLHTLRDLTKQDIPVEQVCRQIKYNTDYTTRYHMVDFLFGLAGADNSYTASEENMLRAIAGYLGINARDYLSIHYRHVGYNSNNGSYGGYGGQRGGHAQSSGTLHKDPYKVLGLESSATDDEVKKSYRRLAMKYHPDKVESMGEEVKKNAEAQFREINEAYEQIKLARGMK